MINWLKRRTKKQRLLSLFLVAVLLSASIFNIFGRGRTSAVTDTFNASGSWQAPTGVTSATVETWGGGGAGGAATGNPSTGGGGAGGAFSVKVIAVTPGNTYTVTVGAGGTAPGGAGGDSWFNTSGTILAKGGPGGATGSVNSTNGAGATGTCTGCIGDTSYAGGNGGTGNYTSGVEGSGAGGGAAGTTGVGGNANINVAGTGTGGGGNGAAGVGNSTAGGIGSAPGGAGSGGKANSAADRAGGAGATGRVLVTYTPPNVAPAAPTLNAPANAATGVSTTPTFTFRTTDADNDYLRYKIEVCSTSNCSALVRTIDQTVSQTGWTGQDTQTSTAYVGNSVISSSTMASHTYQAAALSNSTQYWWRAYAIDPGGTNTFGTASGIFSFTTAAANQAPSAPTLSAPSDTATGVSASPQFQLRSSDADNDYLRYKIEVCSNSTCSVVLRTIDQTASQTGWTGQDQQTATAYTGNSVISSSTIAIHTYQAPALSTSTQYWWRAYAIDPGGTNTFSSVSSIFSFTTAAPSATLDKVIQGGTQIRGGTSIGQ